MGMNPRRQLPRSSSSQATTEPAVDAQHQRPAPATDLPTTPYVRRRSRAGSPQLNSRKNQPSSEVDKPRQPDRVLPCRGRNSSAASAGLSVSELNVEIIVETAIVKANCRKNCPTMPEMNAQGMNTALSTRPTAITGPETSSMALNRRRARRKPMLDVMLDRLDDDDRVVDDDADGQHQAEQREIVQAEADHGHHGGERADDGHRHGDQRNDRRPPALQEHQHHDRHENDRVAQRLENFAESTRE